MSASLNKSLTCFCPFRYDLFVLVKFDENVRMNLSSWSSSVELICSVTQMCFKSFKLSFYNFLAELFLKSDTVHFECLLRCQCCLYFYKFTKKFKMQIFGKKIRFFICTDKCFNYISYRNRKLLTGEGIPCNIFVWESSTVILQVTRFWSVDQTWLQVIKALSLSLTGLLPCSLFLSLLY